MSDDTIYKGIDWERTLTVTRTDTGARKNLTGATIVFELKRRTSDAAATLTRTVGSGITLLTQSGDTEGQATIAIPSATSLGIDAAGNYVYRVLVTPQGETVPQHAIEWTKIPVRD